MFLFKRKKRRFVQPELKPQDPKDAEVIIGEIAPNLKATFDVVDKWINEIDCDDNYFKITEDKEESIVKDNTYVIEDIYDTKFTNMTELFDVEVSDEFNIDSTVEYLKLCMGSDIDVITETNLDIVPSIYDAVKPKPIIDEQRIISILPFTKEDKEYDEIKESFKKNWYEEEEVKEPRFLDTTLTEIDGKSVKYDHVAKTYVKQDEYDDLEDEYYDKPLSRYSRFILYLRNTKEEIWWRNVKRKQLAELEELERIKNEYLTEEAKQEILAKQREVEIQELEDRGVLSLERKILENQNNNNGGN